MTGGNHYEGLLDEIAIYDAVLDATTVTDHFNAGTKTGLVPTRGFAITEIEYDAVAQPDPTVTLTWRKSGAATYIAWLSRDLIDWDEDLDDSVTAEDDDRPADAEHITVTFPLEGDRADAAALFFRIEEG